MKKLKNIEELDALFKQQLDKAQAPAPPDVWANVATSVGGQSAGVVSQLGSYFSSITNIIKVALFVGGVTTVGVLLYNANTADPKGVEPNNNQLDPVTNTNEEDTEGLRLPADTDPDGEESQVLSSTNNSQNNGRADNAVQGHGDDRSANEGLDQGVFEEGEGTEVTDGSSTNDDSEKPRLAILSDRSQICKGETITFNSAGHVKGNWYVNGKLIKRNSEVLSYRFTEGGSQSIELSALREKAGFDLQVADKVVSMEVKDLGNGQYELSLPDNLKVKAWYVNGKEFSTAQTVNARLLAGPTHIMVSATDGECNYTASKQMNIESRGTFSSPDILTPDNDGKNDEYYVDITHYQSFMLQIYDSRTNELVFQTKDPKVRWNGKVNNVGAECSSGLYFVKVSYQLEGEQAKSELIKLTLNR